MKTLNVKLNFFGDNSKISNNVLANDIINECIEDSKVQESIQLSITSDNGHHGKVTKHIVKYNSQESREVNHYPTGDHKTVRNIKTV